MLMGYSKHAAKKYLLSKHLYFDLNNAMWSKILKTGRIYPDILGFRYSKHLLDFYVKEIKN